MPADTTAAVTVKVDQEAGAAYLRLSTNPVARTVELNVDIYVDLDEFGVVRGVELLDLTRPVPLDELTDRFHVTATTLDLLMKTIQWNGPRHEVTGATTSANVSATTVNSLNTSTC